MWQYSGAYMVSEGDRTKTYTTADLCELFKISKSTLYRYESEEGFPPVTRDIRRSEQRLYNKEHLLAISDLQMKQIREMGDRRGDQSVLDRSLEMRAVQRIWAGQVILGIEELSAMAKERPLAIDTIRQLLRFAFFELEPNQPSFAEMLDLIAFAAHRLAPAPAEPSAALPHATGH